MKYYTPVYYGSGRLARIDSVRLARIDSVPFTGLGAATGAGGLGAARLVGDNEIVTPGTVYTFRTWSMVPLDPEAETELSRTPEQIWMDVRRSADTGTSWGVAVGTPMLLPGWILGAGSGAVVGAIQGLRGPGGQTGWEFAERMGWRVAAPRGHASFWQNRTREQAPNGRLAYKTSLNITPTAQGVKASAVRFTARGVLSMMGAGGDISKIAPGWLYERDARQESAGLLRRAAEAVVGRDMTRRATELGREVAGEAEAALLGSTAEREARKAAHKERMIFGYVGAGIAFLLGVFLATRAGSAKVERKAAAAHSVVTQGAARAAMGAAYPPSLIANSRRRRNRGEGPWRVEIRHKGSSTILSRGRFHSRAEAVKYAADQRRWDKKHGWETVIHIVKKPTIADLRRARS